MKRAGLNSRSIEHFTATLFERLDAGIPETLPPYLVSSLNLVSLDEALRHVHYPTSAEDLRKAQFRLKFEELFYIQLNIIKYARERRLKYRGYVFARVGELFHRFYEKNLPFELTGAQKRVIREIRQDMGSGRQMNRLLQGDVGSGKTLVALMSILIALDNGFQACIMAPTEILAEQHYVTFQNLLFVLEDTVLFKSLGMVVIDEQHRFGVAQRARLWTKNSNPPHVLVMTATPIPRTLAMTLYGDLDVSVIDELPPGRKPIQTIHQFDKREDGHQEP